MRDSMGSIETPFEIMSNFSQGILTSLRSHYSVMDVCYTVCFKIKFPL